MIRLKKTYPLANVKQKSFMVSYTKIIKGITILANIHYITEKVIEMHQWRSSIREKVIESNGQIKVSFLFTFFSFIISLYCFYFMISIYDFYFIYSLIIII